MVYDITDLLSPCFVHVYMYATHKSVRACVFMPTSFKDTISAGRAMLSANTKHECDRDHELKSFLCWAPNPTVTAAGTIAFATRTTECAEGEAADAPRHHLGAPVVTP